MEHHSHPNIHHVRRSDNKQYFNVWASAGSVHDNERGIKRFDVLLPHEVPRTLVLIFLLDYKPASDTSRSQNRVWRRKRHTVSRQIHPSDFVCLLTVPIVTEVVRAFQSALALLSQS